MEQKTVYYISEAAKKVQVESHVLRYWEEELELPIMRNEMGHRCYTEQNIRQLKEIKELKEQGLQLKAIRMILRDGKLERWEEKTAAECEARMLQESGEGDSAMRQGSPEEGQAVDRRQCVELVNVGQQCSIGENRGVKVMG